jgi:hypothetical protein
MPRELLLLRDVETLVTTAVEDLPQMIVQLEGAIATLEEPDADPPSDTPPTGWCPGAPTRSG